MSQNRLPANNDPCISDYIGLVNNNPWISDKTETENIVEKLLVIEQRNFYKRRKRWKFEMFKSCVV